MLSYWDDSLCSFLWVKRSLHSSVYLQYQPWTKQTSLQFLQFLLHRSQNNLLIYLARCPNATMLKCCWNRNAAITEIQQRMVERQIRKSFLSLKRRSVKASKPAWWYLMAPILRNYWCNLMHITLLHIFIFLILFVYVYWMKLLNLFNLAAKSPDMFPCMSSIWFIILWLRLAFSLNRTLWNSIRSSPTMMTRCSREQ